MLSYSLSLSWEQATHINTHTHTNAYIKCIHRITCSCRIYMHLCTDMYTAFNRPVYQHGEQPFGAKWRSKGGKERGQTHTAVRVFVGMQVKEEDKVNVE